MTVWSAPPSSFTPSTTSLSVPMPWICAPILLSNRQRSWTCGSRAALKISVLPSASTAARRMFSVPVTVGRSKTMRPPCRRSASATSSWWRSSMRAPIWRRPRRCCSTRRAPMSSPPGRGTRALPKRPRSAPSRRMVARIRTPRSSGTWLEAAPPASISMSASPSLRPPRAVMISPINLVSVTRGTFLSRTGSVVSSAAAISGRAAFLEPLMHRSPASWAPPVIRRTWSAVLPAARSRQPEARLRHRQVLVELDLFGGRQRPGESLLGTPAGSLGLLDRDLVRVLGDVGEHGHAVGQHLAESAAHEEKLFLAVMRDLQRARFEDRHQRGVARQDAELAVGAVGDDEVDVALEQVALDADDSKWYRHQPCCFFIASACARASSMVPTM